MNLKKRTMDEMITHFNDVVSEMNIPRKDKMTLLGMITAIGYEAQNAADVRPVLDDSPYIQAAIDSVIDERKRQIRIWGSQNDASLFEFMSILGEEYGELCEAVNETCFKNPKHRERGGLDNCYKEACHVAAVAVKLMERIEMMREVTENETDNAR